MHIHIIGICGTFMGGLAILAKQLGHTVSGSDQNVYPPMSTQLMAQGIQLMSAYHPDNLSVKPDVVIIGNALSRGNSEVEAVLNLGLPYVSGAQWLADNILSSRWVLAVAGTHGKTTTSSLLTWILQSQGIDSGFLIGGVPMNFGVSAHLGTADFFVVEADEYDCAFFDKRSKFVHYRPRTAILNNLEFDHADIFPDLAAIQKQFHHLVRTIPGEGLIIRPQGDQALDAVLAQGCWTPVNYVDVVDHVDHQSRALWIALLDSADGRQFTVYFDGQKQGTVHWSLTGTHNVYNALAAIAAARHIGILSTQAIAALSGFKNVKRRMEILAQSNTVTLYDDFAHHPTAIATTLEGLRHRVGKERIVAIVEPRSNTMRLGTHRHLLANSLRMADLAMVYGSQDLTWDVKSLENQAKNIRVYKSLGEIIACFDHERQLGGHFVIMSNGSFGGLHTQLAQRIHPN